MIYSFDTIKNRRTIFSLLFFLTILPFVPFAILNVRAWFPISPSMFISLGIPILISASITLLIIRTKKKLFWARLNLSIDEKQSSLTINGNQYAFHDLEYFDYKRGSFLTSGIERIVLFLKFKDDKKVMIMPCKSSTDIKNYDNFIEVFTRISKEKNLSPISLKKKMKPLLIAFILIPIVFFTITWLIGQLISLKLLSLFLLPNIIIFSFVGIGYLRKNSNLK